MRKLIKPVYTSYIFIVLWLRKTTKSNKNKFRIAVLIASFMLFFMGFTLASAETIYQIHYPQDGSNFAYYGAVSNGTFYAPDFYNDPNYTGIMATGTMSTFTANWRYINFGGFSSASPYQLQLYTGNTPQTGQILDCVSDPNATAGDYVPLAGVAEYVTFNFTGTQCDLYPGTRYGFIIAGGSDSGASQFAWFSDTTNGWSGDHQSIIIADTGGVTNPDLLLPLPPTPTTPLDFETRLIDATAQGFSSTSINFNVDYVISTAEYTANTRPDYITTQILNNDGQQVTSANKLILPLTDGFKTTNITTNYAFPDGDYIAYFHFWNVNTNSITFEQTGIVLSFTIAGGAVSNTDLLEQDDGIGLSDQLTYEDCSISNIDGCFKNVLIFTFVPDAGSLDKFVGLYEKIENKPPFGYVSSVKNALSGIGTSGSSAFDFGSIPFQSQIFDPFKAILIIGLWFLYALFFMGRLNKLNI